MENELAIKAVEEYLGLLRQAETAVNRRTDMFGYLSDGEYQRLDSELNSRNMLVGRIFDEVDDRLAARFRSEARYSWGHSTEIEPTELLLGVLKRQEEADAIFGPKGPQLAANELHAWIWAAAARLWDDGHFADAVRNASMELFDVRLPAKLGVQEREALMIGLLGRFPQMRRRHQSLGSGSQVSLRVRRIGPVLMKVRCSSVRGAPKG
jgi:hypothetical protein